ncbi:hypothetical protein K7W42_18590 [Deinococcus sp. HMF7604]|uniref:hypothetical protein n=1 Tax=Deinococcus betulae TaxID=2873312 RepID=UPI001CCFB439|nr:hypothetical protein [Deinococcus betulae]MBZ9752852.1 hypothetical protein [Deinococcus betulae]
MTTTATSSSVRPRAHLFGVALLLLVAFVWGSMFVVVKHPRTHGLALPARRPPHAALLAPPRLSPLVAAWRDHRHAPLPGGRL